MIDEYTQALCLVPQDSFRDLAERLGMEVAGPSKSGSFLIRDPNGLAWLFGGINSLPGNGNSEAK